MDDHERLLTLDEDGLTMNGHAALHVLSCVATIVQAHGIPPHPRHVFNVMGAALGVGIGKHAANREATAIAEEEVMDTLRTFMRMGLDMNPHIKPLDS